MSAPLLSVQNLRVSFASPDGNVRALDGVALELARGGALAVVGETGSGKTTLARALLGLHPAECVAGSIRLDGDELNRLDEPGWQRVRWRRIALAAQNAGTAFDPVYRAGEQIVEPLRLHLGLSETEAWQRARTLAEQTGLTERHLRAYPHQLSGGEKQRLMLAMALSCQPDLLVLDEPTSGQDMRSRAQMIALLRRLRAQSGLALLLISHDLAAAAALTEQTAVLYAGKVVEAGATRDLLTTPRHPYTWGLLNAYPNMTTTRDLSSIRGQMPDPARPPDGCRFHPRCNQAVDDCRRFEPPLERRGGRLVACHLGGVQTLLQADNLHKTFVTNGHAGPDSLIEAVRGVSLAVLAGEVVGVVGETGSGKTTLGRLLAGLLTPDAGAIYFEGQDIQAVNGAEGKNLRRRIQAIPQDPFESVDPLFTVRQIVRQPLDIQRIQGDRDALVRDALAAVGLPAEGGFLQRRPHELSGGQLQRVVIARALVLEPRLLVADEPVSMLDPSEGARLMNLLKRIQNERGMGMLLISHDLALVRKVADRILVMRGGAIIEQGLSSVVISRPQHDYTRALLLAAPSFNWFPDGSQGADESPDINNTGDQ
ncbi:MAG: ABC transporter ATP-binding protein [Chloroflexi bacterium]|nr:ABC transporter ATP-binding protein [Chloroflexota bacterium]